MAGLGHVRAQAGEIKEAVLHAVERGHVLARQGAGIGVRGRRKERRSASSTNAA